MRNSRASYLDPGGLRPIGAHMEQLGKDIFASPALTLQENRHGRFGGPIQLLSSEGHHRGLPKDHIHRRQIADVDKFGCTGRSHSFSSLGSLACSFVRNSGAIPGVFLGAEPGPMRNRLISAPIPVRIQLAAWIGEEGGILDEPLCDSFPPKSAREWKGRLSYRSMQIG